MIKTISGKVDGLYEGNPNPAQMAAHDAKVSSAISDVNAEVVDTSGEQIARLEAKFERRRNFGAKK